MARKKRGFSPIGLAFLDIMSCGFGAAVLLFLIIKHNFDLEVGAVEQELSPIVDARKLEREIGEKEAEAEKLAQRSGELDINIASLEAENTKLKNEVTPEVIKSNPDLSDENIDGLKSSLLKLDKQVAELRNKAKEQGRRVRTFKGIGNREYLSGLKFSSRRTLILLDKSASMLDRRIVSILRKRNMSASVQRKSAKWQQSLKIAEWITTRFSKSGQYQIYLFNTKVESAVPNTLNKWLSVANKKQFDQAVANIYRHVPKEGTSLKRVFVAAGRLNPRPDIIFLITDGLPTQSLKIVNNKKVSGSKRLDYFVDAVKALPRAIPVNTILLPLEGDPLASASYWQLAQSTNGAFISPTKDWP